MSTSTSTGGLRGNYALNWDSFVGQERAKKQLRKAALSARARNTRLPHTLLASGTPGIGKTNLAILTAAEHGGRLTTVTGKLTADAARAKLVRMRDGDILFVDEIHTLVAGGKAQAEWLLHFMQDGVLLGPRGPEEQPDVTILAATTDAGRLPEPLLQRFALRPTLSDYDDSEAALIAHRLAERILLDWMPRISQRNAQQIAAAAANAPREMSKVLINVRDTCLTEEAANWNEDQQEYDVSQSLLEMGLTPDGLSEQARRFMLVMLENDGGPVGEAALRDRLQEPGGLLSTERLLVGKGYLVMTPRGRQLTAAGLRRAVDLEDVDDL